MPDCPAQEVAPAIPSGYNFGPIHKTFRLTPAMAAGVAQHVWSVENIVGLLDAAEKKAAQSALESRMAIIPQIRCSRFAEAFEFYTKILDFEYVEGDDPTTTNPAFSVLSREGDLIFLCNFDGGDRSVIAVMTDDVDAVFRKFRARGLQTPGDPDAPAEEVHQGPLDQTWGTREFYVEDPDGNSLRFTQVLQAESGTRAKT